MAGGSLLVLLDDIATVLDDVAVLSGIALIMTVGVYGLVAGIVKLDDAGLYLTQKPGTHPWTKMQHLLGRACLQGAPYLMKTLSIVGTAAMFMVGGGILIHGIPVAHHFIEGLAQSAANVGSAVVIGGVLEVLTSSMLNALAGSRWRGGFVVVRGGQ